MKTKNGYPEFPAPKHSFLKPSVGILSVPIGKQSPSSCNSIFTLHEINWLKPVSSVCANFVVYGVGTVH